MRKALAVLMLVQLCLAQGGMMPGPGTPHTTGGSAPSVVQAQNCHPGTSGACTTTAMTVTSTHTIVACSQVASLTGVTFTLTASTGTDTFSTINITTGTTPDVACVWILSTSSSGSTTFTCTWAVSAGMGCVVYEISGVTTGLDGTAVEQSQASTTAWACAAYTIVHSNSLAFCYIGGVTTTTTLVAVSPYAFSTNASNAGTDPFGMEWASALSTGSQTATMTAGTARSNSSIAFALY